MNGDRCATGMPPMKRVLFLCTGNCYRSRFAEICFNWHAEQRNLR